MTYRVLMTDRAEGDVAAVLRWFRDQKATDAGRRWLAQLMMKLDTLMTRPSRCSLAPESEMIGEEVRELLLGRGRAKHRILFKTTGRDVVILRIWHSSRRPLTGDDLQG